MWIVKIGNDQVTGRIIDEILPQLNEVLKQKALGELSMSDFYLLSHAYKKKMTQDAFLLYAGRRLALYYPMITFEKKKHRTVRMTSLTPGLEMIIAR